MSGKKLSLTEKESLDFVVVSPGGCGCSYFMNILQRTQQHLRFNAPGDNDRLKHVSKHNIDLLDGVRKVLYLFNHPALAIESHFRRGIEKHQTIKLLGKAMADTKQEYTMKVIEARRDLFGIEIQYDTILKNDMPTLFIDFNSIQDNKREIQKFLGLNDLFFQSFKISNRHSVLSELDSSYKKVYDSLYSKLLDMNGKLIN